MEIQISLVINVEHSSVSFENTGKDPLENLKIGLYKSHLKRRRWAFNNAYLMEIPRLDTGQNINFPLEDFKRKQAGNGTKINETFSLDASANQYVDCWVHTKNSSHIFQFEIPAKKTDNIKDDF